MSDDYEHGSRHVGLGGGSADFSHGSDAWRGAANAETAKAWADTLHGSPSSSPTNTNQSVPPTGGGYSAGRSSAADHSPSYSPGTDNDRSAPSTGGSYSTGRGSGGWVLVGLLAAGAIAAAVIFSQNDKKPQSSGDTPQGQAPSYAEDENPRPVPPMATIPGDQAVPMPGNQILPPQDINNQPAADSYAAIGAPPADLPQVTQVEASEIPDVVNIGRLKADADFYPYQLPQGALPTGPARILIAQVPVTLSKDDRLELWDCHLNYCEAGSAARGGIFGLVAAAKVEVVGQGRVGDITGIQLERPSGKGTSAPSDTAGLY